MQNSDCRDAFSWSDETWLAYRGKHPFSDAPLNIYEVHLGSWRRTGEGGYLSCKEITQLLVPYVKQMGFTHVLLLSEPNGFAQSADEAPCPVPSSSQSLYGSPDEFKGLVNELHKAGIGVFTDWICPDLPDDALADCALVWLESCHLDGLRPIVSPERPLQQFNRAVWNRFPDICLIGSGDCRPAQGFSFLQRDPFSAPSAPFPDPTILSLSHSEVAHGKGSLLGRMPGTDEEKYAAVRAFYTYMLGMPGKMLTMMGSEFGQWKEWDRVHSLDWHLLDQQDEDGRRHRLLQSFFRCANDVYLKHPALWQQDCSSDGFRWLCADKTARVFAFLRTDKQGRSVLIAVNFSPDDREHCRIGVPFCGRYTQVFHTDRMDFGGENRFPPFLSSEPTSCCGMDHSLSISLPPLSAIILNCPHHRSGKK